MQLLFEVKQVDLAVFHAAASRLGITPVVGYAEIPMQGGTVCLTMDVPPNSKGNLKQLPGVVGTFSNFYHALSHAALPRYNMEIDLNGTFVKLDGLHIGRTYAGMMEGLPTPEVNIRTINRLKDEAAKLFPHGQHRIFVPLPTTKAIDTSFFSVTTKQNYPNPESLPEYYLIICLDGPATDAAADGATALLLFFADNITAPLPQLIPQLCKTLIWKDISYDYEY